MYEIIKELENLKTRIQSIVEKKNIPLLINEKKSLEDKSNTSGFWNNSEESQKVMRRLGEINFEIEELNTIQNKLNTLFELSQDKSLNELDEKALYSSDIFQLILDEIKLLKKITEEVETTTFLSSKFDTADAIVKIIAGQGGTEACDWASMVFRMYLRYCNSRGWKVIVHDQVPGTEAGIASVEFEVQGKYAYGFLKNEHGTHRLVRNSPFNAQGLRQTSFAGVEVMPVVIDDVDIEIPEKDIEFTATRSSGAGGQNVNKVNTKARIVHIPTGITVESSSQRSQSQNRETAMKILKARLYEIEEAKRKNELAEVKGDYKIAGFGNQIRNYILEPYKLVKDVRTNIETADVNAVLDGKIDLFIDGGIRKL